MMKKSKKLNRKPSISVLVERKVFADDGTDVPWADELIDLYGRVRGEHLLGVGILAAAPICN